ncbi:M23 family metallopeptidase [Empedobacter brevis]
MMKKYMYKLMILGIFFSTSLVFGQFNTLKPMIPKKSETKISEKLKKDKKTEIQEENKEKKSLKKILGITTKSDLRNEIDSLITWIKEFNSSHHQKRNDQNLKDSLIWQSQPEKVNIQKRKTTVSKYDFVEEPEDYFPKIVMPLNRKIAVTSPYGMRIHPISGISKFHNGIDLAAHYENVYAVMDGIITEASWDNKGGGNYIKINHFNRFETAYLHLSEIYYRVGERVNAGFIIAKSGNTGNSTGPHLHFAVKEFGQRINPSHFLNDLIKVNNLIATYYAK